MSQFFWIDRPYVVDFDESQPIRQFIVRRNNGPFIASFPYSDNPAATRDGALALVGAFMMALGDNGNDRKRHNLHKKQI